jgi:predicted amidohydrolase YtcJ
MISGDAKEELGFKEARSQNRVAGINKATEFKSVRVRFQKQYAAANGALPHLKKISKGRFGRQLADLVVLAQDPIKTHPIELVKVQIERTMVGSVWKYES